jgi:hypothetical protein
MTPLLSLVQGFHRFHDTGDNSSPITTTLVILIAGNNETHDNLSLVSTTLAMKQLQSQQLPTLKMNIK